MKIILNPKWFNPLYFIINDLLRDNSVRTILIYGGKSSAKTFSVSQILIKESVVKYANSICFRKESTTIPTTLKKSFEGAINTTYLFPAFEVQDRIFLCDNGSEVVLKGMDDEGKAKGVESYKYVLMDELDQFAEKEYDTIEMSLRGQPGQKIFACWNPIDENSWVKTNLVDKQEWVDTEYKLPCENSFVRKSKNGLFILIKTTYEDNYWVSGSPDGKYGFVDVNLIAKYKAMKEKNYNRYKVEVLGEWGKVEYGGEIYKKYNPEKQIRKTVYNPLLPIHLTFDFNVNPYMSASAWQIDGKRCEKILEFCLSHPRNTSMAICAEFERVYMSHDAGLFIYGDPGGLKQSTADETLVRVKEKDYSEFSKIFDRLKKYKPINRVQRAYPPVVLRVNFINTIFESGFDGIEIFFGENCKMTHREYENLKEASDGTKHKEKYKDEITGVQCEKYGHISDHDEYFICSAFSNELNKYKNGDKPLSESILPGKIVHGKRNRY